MQPNSVVHVRTVRSHAHRHLLRGGYPQRVNTTATPTSPTPASLFCHVAGGDIISSAYATPQPTRIRVCCSTWYAYDVPRTLQRIVTVRYTQYKTELEGSL